VLLAVADSEYRFTFVDIVAYGKDLWFSCIQRNFILEITRERFIKYSQFETFE
jgi:hypothetical protein